MLGQTVTSTERVRWDLTIGRDGQGLPKGSGTPAEGKPIYRDKCEVCHGQEGRGATAEELVGGIGSLSSQTPDRTLGSYWPYAPTIFDYIRRAMPIDAPFSLDDHEVYALTAYLLYLNKIIPQNHTLDAETLARVRMPNREGFIRYDVGEPP